MKKNNDFWAEILIILFYVLFVGGCIALSAWIIHVIVDSDLPLWLKVLLLR